MPDTENDPMESYREQMEHHELAKQQGAEAYAEAIIEMLPEMDEDKAILIKEGLKAVLGGPPSLSFPPMLQFPPQVDAEFIPPPPPYFVRENADGSTTVYDWMAIASTATHTTRTATGEVRLMYGEELVMRLTDDAAENYWKWQQNHIQNYERGMAGMPVMLRGGRR